MLDTHPTELNHFSADVRIKLLAGGETFDVASIGPTEIILRELHDIAIGDAEIVLSIDGSEFRWPVHLPEGAVPFSHEVYLIPRGPLMRAAGQ